MISTIIFDLAEVYLKGLLGVEHFFEPILKEPAREIFSKLQENQLIALFRGEITEEEYWLRILKKNKWDVDIEHLKRAIRENFEEIEGTRQIIEKLKKKGFRLGLLSVHAKEWINYCNEKFDYHKLFDSILYSFEIGILKPDKRAYYKILKKLDAKPDKCIFIDDNRKNIEAAKKLGINTIHFKNAEQLKRELVSFSIHLN